MPQKLKGNSAVVTGGGRGMGRGIALALASEGAHVVVNDIASDRDGTNVADKVVAEITKAKGIAVANYDSVATMVGGENIIKTATKNFGRIDILVNCAGNFQFVPTIELTERDWDSIIDVHLKGHLSCTKAAVMEMTKQKSARIINFSSRGAFFGVHNLAYATVKAGIMGFTAMLSRELKEYGITVNAILPSAVTQLFPGDIRPRMGDNMPSILSPQPDFVAPIVVYLATEDAKNITGQFIYVAGGDICIYTEPLQLATAHKFIRKPGKWTPDELGEVVPSMLGLG